MADDDFSDYPVSLGEVRSGQARSWTPRDALIHALRELDSGRFVPDALVVVSRVLDEDGGTLVKYQCASPDLHATLGMLTAAQMKFWEEA